MLLFILCLVASHMLAISAESTKTIIVPLPTSPPSSSYTSRDEFKSTALSVSNRFRAQHNASALVWNDTLADSALQWAKQCHWKHSTVGENLAKGYPNLTAAIEAWGDERSKYNFGKPGFSEKTGHFTQLVWKSTSTLGCDRFDCGNDKNRDVKGWYVVCHYWPPGNVVGGDLFQENVQKQITTAAGGAAEWRKGCGMCAVVLTFGTIVGGMLGWA